jgi:hypothetical protein
MKLALALTLMFWLGVLLLILGGCDEIKEIPKELDPIDNSQTPDPTPTIDFRTNPVCKEVESFKDGGGGNVWKPESDHGGILVVLLRDEFVKQFSSCEVTRKGGKVESLRFTGFSNGNRQTWRGSLSGGRYEDNGRVVCKEFKQTCTFGFKGAARNRHD